MQKSDNQIYLNQLKGSLKGIPNKEYKEAIQYYTEYLADLNTNDLNEIVKCLGTAKKLAHQIEANYLITEDDNETKQSEKKSINQNLKLIFTILLAISSPILFVLAIALLIILAALIFAIVLSIIFTSFVGISLFIKGLTIIASKGIIALFIAGSGIAMFGLDLALISTFYFVIKFIIRKLVRIFKFIYSWYQSKDSKKGI